MESPKLKKSKSIGSEEVFSTDAAHKKLETFILHNLSIKKLTDRQHLLLEFARKKHEGQVRKYTNDPYINHPVAVADIASRFMDDDGAIEIAICHDLLEDTDCTSGELNDLLMRIGYDRFEAMGTVISVIELTDEYTHEKYPEMNRETRKRMEAERMGKTNYLSQSVKYADLIHNTSSIVKHDKGFAKVYLKEKKRALDAMRGGNIDLFIECCYTFKKAMKKLEK